jgi:hypothetical protein
MYPPDEQARRPDQQQETNHQSDRVNSVHNFLSRPADTLPGHQREPCCHKFKQDFSRNKVALLKGGKSLERFQIVFEKFEGP